MWIKTGKFLYFFTNSFFLWAWVLSPPPLSAQGLKPTEYQVKAAFIYHILQFVEWPNTPAKGPKSSINLYILGENNFGNAWEAYQGETIQGHNWSIKAIHSLQDLKDGQVLFICASEKGRLPQILHQAKELGLLTIGDTGGFGRQGVMVNFFLEGNKIRFEINTDTVRRTGLKISSELLKLAKIVREIW